MFTELYVHMEFLLILTCNFFIIFYLDGLRAESVVLKEHLESQSKELKLRSLQIKELEEKERIANESVCNSSMF